MTPTVADWMSTKLVTAAPDEPLIRALELMAERRIRHVLVVDSGGALAGIVSNRDFVRAAFRQVAAPDLHRAPIADVMTRAPLITVGSTTPLRDAAERLRVNRISALPVLDDGRLVGILTTDDVLAAVAAGRAPLGG